MLFFEVKNKLNFHELDLEDLGFNASISLPLPTQFLGRKSIILADFRNYF